MESSTPKQQNLELPAGLPMDRTASSQSTDVPSIISIPDSVDMPSLQQSGELPFEAADLESKGQLDASSLRRENIRGLRRIIFNFVPQWFLIPMGTGNLATIIFLIPFKARWLYWLSVVVFALDVAIFVSFCAICLLRYAMYPRLAPMVLRHPMQALYLGPFTVSFASITNLIARICAPAWGQWAVYWAWAFWWVDVVMAVTVMLGVMFCMLRFHNHTRLDDMVAVWLLPSISSIVAASSGAIVAGSLPPTYALWTYTVSFVLWGCGVPLAMMVLAMYFHRLALRFSLPDKVIFSVFLPLGPLAQGAHGTMELGSVALRVFPATGSLPAAVDAGQIIYVFGWLTAVVFWAFAAVWLAIAFATLVDRRRIPFNLGWWSVIFPTGVFALSTMQIGDQMSSPFFKVLGTVFTAMNAAVWLLLIALTLRGVWKGTLFGKPKEGGELEKSKPC